MTESIYEVCTACAESRAQGEFESVVKCHGCKGEGFRRKPSSYLCNACSGPLCPETSSPNADIPHGLVGAKVSGGYDSPHLTDTVTYTFSLCERCLRKMFARFEIKPMLGNYMALDSGTYEEDAEWYDHRKWKEFGGQATKFETGLCNARKSCQEKAVLRHFVSGHMTDEAFCAEHAEKCGYGNSDFVLVEEVAGISSKVEERSEEDKVRVADAWLTVASRPDTITHHRYVPSCIRELVGCPEETGAFWVPRNVMIESPLLDGLEVQTLFRGTLVYGPEKTLRQRARENYPAIKPAVLLRGAEDEHDELA